MVINKWQVLEKAKCATEEEVSQLKLTLPPSPKVTNDCPLMSLCLL